ncbi:hypothetical protein GEMRC1_004774 [Eukaryota sp. GEM-RC1]
MSTSRELISLQVGQCGNQIGWKFWDTLIQEHDLHSFTGLAEASSTFFSIKDSTTSSKLLKARAVLVDTEERVLSETHKRAAFCQSSIKTSFVVVAQSGSGNNWADGYFEYGPSKGEETIEALRRQAEDANSLQGILMFHSVGGGTGSGLGSWLLEHIPDNFGKIAKLTFSVFPGQSDDVITSPYNTIFSLSSLAEHSDISVVLDNEALTKLVTSDNSPQSRTEKPFDSMNQYVARFISDFLAPMRYPGSLNVDVGELTTNLVPFPSLSFAAPALASMSSSNKGITTVTELFKAVTKRDKQLCSIDLNNRTLLSSALFGRGKPISIYDLNAGAKRLQDSFPLAYWSDEIVKIGLTSMPPSKTIPASAVALFNSCGVTGVLDSYMKKFDTLFSRKAFASHYEKWMTFTEMKDKRDAVCDVGAFYNQIEQTPPPTNYRIIPIV